MTSFADAVDVTVQVQRLRVGAKLPYRASEWATGWDLYACLDEEITLGQVPVMVPTGIAIAVPPGWDAQVRPRSGLAKKGILATFGTVDADYRGELMVTLYTVAPGIDHTICDGDRIAQLVISRVATPAFDLVEALDATGRGERGHGSTGA